MGPLDFSRVIKVAENISWTNIIKTILTLVSEIRS